MVRALASSSTPRSTRDAGAVRRRLPFVLKSCASIRARDGLLRRRRVSADVRLRERAL
jgi:hypothetical protein